MIFPFVFLSVWHLLKSDQNTFLEAELFDLSCRDGATASWVINQYFRGVKCLAQGHNTAAVGFEPPTSRSGVRHSTTEPPRSPVKIGAWKDQPQDHAEEGRWIALSNPLILLRDLIPVYDILGWFPKSNNSKNNNKMTTILNSISYT